MLIAWANYDKGPTSAIFLHSQHLSGPVLSDFFLSSHPQPTPFYEKALVVAVTNALSILGARARTTIDIFTPTSAVFGAVRAWTRNRAAPVASAASPLDDVFTLGWVNCRVGEDRDGH